MALHTDLESNDEKIIFKNLNLTFSIIFIIEAVLKMSANGISAYFHSSWNTFDFFVVSISIFDMFSDE